MDEDNILAAPYLEDALNPLRLSTSSANTFATTTTRASSVMPQATSNLGMSKTRNDEMDQDELRSHYGRTSVGVKNAQLGMFVLPEQEARKKNVAVELAFNKAKKAEYAKEAEEEKRQKKRKLATKKRHRLGFLVCILIVVLAGVGGAAFVFIAGENGEGNDSNSQDNNLPTTSPPTSIAPTEQPTFENGGNLTDRPTFQPTNSPSPSPTLNPSFTPTPNPTFSPTLSPTLNPNSTPTLKPTLNPSILLNNPPTSAQTQTPIPTFSDPTPSPSVAPFVQFESIDRFVLVDLCLAIESEGFQSNVESGTIIFTVCLPDNEIFRCHEDGTVDVSVCQVCTCGQGEIIDRRDELNILGRFCVDNGINDECGSLDGDGLDLRQLFLDFFMPLTIENQADFEDLCGAIGRSERSDLLDDLASALIFGTCIDESTFLTCSVDDVTQTSTTMQICDGLICGCAVGSVVDLRDEIDSDLACFLQNPFVDPFCEEIDDGIIVNLEQIEAENNISIFN